MKKSLWIVLLLALVCTLALSACDDTNQPQTPNEDHVHAFGEWTTVKDATCTVKGEQERICSCGEKETKSIDATGHTEVIDAAVDPACNATGLTEGKHCSVCNETIVAQEVVAKLEHTPATDAAVEATCSATGLTEGSHCSVCNAVITAQQVVAKKAHTTSDWITDTEATCSVAGAKHKECTVCHTVLESGSIDKIAHTPVTDAAVEATCTTTGLTEGKHCSVCNIVIVNQQNISKLEHQYENHMCKACGISEPNGPGGPDGSERIIIKISNNGEILELGEIISGLFIAYSGTNSEIVLPLDNNNLIWGIDSFGNFYIEERGTIVYNFNGTVKSIGNTNISYNFSDQISKIGNTYISYNFSDQISKIGDTYISYNLNKQINKIGNTYISYNANGKVSQIGTK